MDTGRAPDDTSDSECVICPWCGDQQGDAWEWVKDYPVQETCSECGGEMRVWAEHDVTYYASAQGDRPTPTTQLDERIGE